MNDQDIWQSAVRAHQDGQIQHAKTEYEKLVAAEPPHTGACYMLGRLYSDLNEIELAREHFARARAMSPEWIDPTLALVRLETAEKNYDDAEAALKVANAIHGTSAQYHEVAAELLEASGSLQSAIRALEFAITLNDATPNTLLALADILRRGGLLPDALKIYSRSMGYPETLKIAAINSAGIHQRMGNAAEAARHYLLASPEQSSEEWVFQYADALRDAGHIEAWIASATRIASTLPNDKSALRLNLEIASFQGNYSEIEQSIANLRKSNPADTATWLEIALLRLHYDHTAVDSKVFYANLDRSAAMPQLPAPTVALNARSENGTRPLRIGYIGADFRDHVMGRMALAMLENRDRVSHKAICYALNAKEDAFTQRFLATADGYVRCAAGTDDAIAAKIAADRLDILVDLSGPTSGSRPGVLARKPAPVQITHVGAAGPIGLSAVDYKLTDSLCDLPENQEYLIEKLLPMAGCCYPVPKYPLPTAGVTKADLELEGKIVIGAFYSYMKLSERCVRLWKRLLDDIPNGVLLFSPLDPKLKVAYENIMRAAEIPAAQFRFIPSGPTEAERLARYRVVDFVIDSMPYGGVNGTLEALYMGVPVVTLLGSHHSERTSASMMTHLGVTDTIAQSPSQYVQIARKLANEPPFRTDVSTRIRARWPKFVDPTDYARRWEAVLRKVAR